METSDRPGIARLFLEAIRRLFADEAIPLAGNIAFRVLFSIFPFLIVLTALAGFFGSSDLATRIVTYLLSVAPTELVTPIAPEIHSILTKPRSGLLSLSILLTVWSATGGVDSVRVALNRAYGITEDRNLLLLYLITVLFVFGAAIILLAIAVLIVFAPIIVSFANRYAPGLDHIVGIFNRYRYPAAVLLLTAGLFFAHLILPARRVRWRYLFPGVAFTVIAWIVLSSVFSSYLVHFRTFASTYAGLSGLFAAMFLLYLSALALIFGGEINRVIVLRMKLHRPADEETDLSKE
jgi:membrane protein